MSKIQEFDPNFMKDNKSSLFISAGGFEPRVKGIIDDLKGINEKLIKYCNILEYQSSVLLKQNAKSKEFLKKNEENLESLKESLKRLSIDMLPNTLIDIDNILEATNNLKRTFNDIPKKEIDTVFIDISGMANFLILLVLHQVKNVFYDKKIQVLYTEAEWYYPKIEESDKILELAKKRDEESIFKLSELLGASGARETIILPDFSGSFREDLPICLIFFVGYEPSRAIGLLEAYRPNLVIACYGESPHSHFKWRKEFSKKLHKEFGVFNEYPHIEMEISTFEVSEILSSLEKIYTSQGEKNKILYESYNIAISPQCSKLQTVASYLFCQSHPDVQIVFCLPGFFNPERYSEGIGKRSRYELQ